jgi:hypothetical protein
MQREIDLIRQILLDLEAGGAYTNWMDIDHEDYSPEQIDYHLELLAEAGLISVGTSERGRLRLLPVRLTWEGHEFLDVARPEGRWANVTEALEATGSVPFAVLGDALLQMVRREAEEQLSLDP